MVGIEDLSSRLETFTGLGRLARVAGCAEYGVFVSTGSTRAIRVVTTAPGSAVPVDELRERMSSGVPPCDAVPELVELEELNYYGSALPVMVERAAAGAVRWLADPQRLSRLEQIASAARCGRALERAYAAGCRPSHWYPALSFSSPAANAPRVALGLRSAWLWRQPRTASLGFPEPFGDAPEAPETFVGGVADTHSLAFLVAGVLASWLLGEPIVPGASGLRRYQALAAAPRIAADRARSIGGPLGESLGSALVADPHQRSTLAQLLERLELEVGTEPTTEGSMG